MRRAYRNFNFRAKAKEIERMSKEAIELLEKRKQTEICQEQGEKKTCPCCGRWIKAIDQAITFLKPPDCSLCGDKKVIPRLCYEDVPCPDCQEQIKQQPTAGEFTKEVRRRAEGYKMVYPKPVFCSVALQACDIIDRAEATNRDLLKVCGPFARLADMIPEPDAPDPQWEKINTAIRALPLDRYREARAAIAKANKEE